LIFGEKLHALKREPIQKFDEISEISEMLEWISRIIAFSTSYKIPFCDATVFNFRGRTCSKTLIKFQVKGVP
jgi:hypothetical protein